MSDRFYHVFQTEQGWVGVLASLSGIRRSTLPCETPDESILSLGPEVCGATQDKYESSANVPICCRRIWQGEEVDFADVELDVGDATEFYIKAWDACRSIPRGETRTYGWLATQAGNPNASRAAGQTMARNRVPLIVPCHRVVGSDGSLRGFGSGSERLDLKRWLLDMESGSRFDCCEAVHVSL